VTTIGHSVGHRAIRMVVIGDPRTPNPTLVVGCVHGNERAGIAIARRLAAGPAPRGTALWIIPDLNPDGVAAGTRQNAHGVDLNRNFPYRWRASRAAGDPQYGGPRPLSEPESVLLHALVVRVAPRLSIWFHQPLGATDRSGGDVRVERRFAALSGLPLRQLTRYPGSATTWQDHAYPNATAFVAELPAGRLARAAVSHYAGAVLRLASESASARQAGRSAPRPSG
jgi:protein MpaA